MTVPVPLGFSKMAQINNLVTIGKTSCRDQTQQPEQQAREKPHPAVASLLLRNRRSQEGAGQM